MKIILLEQVRKLGKIGEVVDVKNGYARNLLIPSKKALLATKSNIAFFKEKRAEIEKENKAKSSTAGKQVGSLEGTIISIIEQAGDDGRLYGSVTTSSISSTLSKVAKTDISRKQIVLSEPIKYIGIYDVEVSLYADISATIKVNIARTENEAQEALKKPEDNAEKISEDKSEEEAVSEEDAA